MSTPFFPRSRRPAEGVPEGESLSVSSGIFAHDATGGVAITFSLTVFVIFLMIGGAIDFGRWLNARDQTLEAIDAAVLAAGRALQTGATDEVALALAKTYYDKNVEKRLRVEEDDIHFSVVNNGTTVAARGSAYIRTPFMSLATVSKLSLFNASEGSEATTARENYTNVNREVSLMLDVSGSMCMPCTKRDDMKAAAKDLVEILMKNNGKSPYWAKVALVPFSGDVRPSPQLYAKVTDPSWPSSRSIGNGRNNRHRDDDDESQISYLRTACVGERVGNEKHSNAAPGPGAYVMATYNLDFNRDGQGDCYVAAEDTMRPLTDNKSSVLAAIDGLKTGGSTAGHVGTAWSYYFLSPQWNAVLPDTSHASDFGASKLRKFAVLMTDGEYNAVYDKDGIPAGFPGAGSSANGSSSSGQAIAICNQMKQDGIEVYTVGFDLGSNDNAINTLKNCASDKSRAYTVETGEQLKQAFRDIAIRLTELHLSK